MLLVWLAIAFVAGVVAGTAFVAPVAATFWLVCVLLALTWLARRRRFWLTPLILAALCAGFLRAPHQGAATPSDLRFYNSQTVELSGTVSAEPDIRDTGANYVVSVQKITLRGHTRSVSGSLRIHTSSANQLEYGDQVTVRGRLLGISRSSDPAWADSQARQGIFSEMRFPRLTDLGPGGGTVQVWIANLRARLANGIDTWLPEPEAALLIAITLGARSASLGDLAPALVATGLIHLIAISGIKVALIAGMAHQLFRRLVGRFTGLFVSLAAIWFYVVLTGLTASGTRSAIMWSLVFVAAALGRNTVALVSLSVAVAVMIALEPSLPWDIGFQLSVLGTIYIVGLGPALIHLLRALPSPWRQSLGVSLAAQLGTLPVVIVGFHLVSYSGPLTNAAVLPMLPFLILLGFALGAVSSISALATPVSALAYVLLHAIVELSHFVAGLGAIQVPVVSQWLVVGWYTCLTTVALWLLRRSNWTPLRTIESRAREFASAGLIGASMLTYSWAHAQPAPAARLDIIGSGNAMLLRSGDMSALIDGSPRPFQLLERLGTLLPATERVIDLVIVTDPRGKSAEGLDALLDHYSVREVLDVGVEYPSLSYAHWRRDLRSRGIPDFALRTGATVDIGAARIVAVGPDAVSYNAADSIGLLRVSLPGKTILVIGAASTREQHETLFRPVHLRADILVAGGRLDPAFVSALHPGLIIDDQAAKGPEAVG